MLFARVALKSINLWPVSPYREVEINDYFPFFKRDTEKCVRQNAVGWETSTIRSLDEIQ